MTPLAIRMSRRRNGVSRLHGEVARAMWHPLFPDAVETPITHVTNGAHLPTFVSEPIRELLFDEHLGDDWLERPRDPASWEGVREIPNERALGRALRGPARGSSSYLRDEGRAGQPAARRAARLRAPDRDRASTPDALTIGFARRLATYKRLHLLTHDPARARRIFTGDRPAQLVIAGKAHPNDEPGKDVAPALLRLRARRRRRSRAGS